MAVRPVARLNGIGSLKLMQVRGHVKAYAITCPDGPQAIGVLRRRSGKDSPVILALLAR